jgi:hypothetical protein
LLGPRGASKGCQNAVKTIGFINIFVGRSILLEPREGLRRVRMLKKHFGFISIFVGRPILLEPRGASKGRENVEKPLVL